MWQCSSCDYFNEDLDDTCQKCGAERVEAAGAAGATDPPGAAESTQAPAADDSEKGAEQREPSTSKAVSVVLIIACLLAIGAVGYLAWQRGLIGRILPAGEQTAEVEDGQAGVDVWAGAPPAPGGFERRTKAARAAIDAVLEAAVDTTVTFADDGSLSVETDEELRELAELSSDLAWQYEEFEQAVLDANDPQLGEYAQFVRDRFELAMLESLGVIAQAYRRDLEGEHPSYLVSDAYLQAAENFGLLDTAELEDQWDAAAHARHQLELDQQYTEHYRQLAARVETLKAIHSEFNSQLSAMPPYTVRSGVLGKSARDLLDLLGELAEKIQELVVEFEEYEATLSGLEPSDRMQEYITQFESLAKTDHLYAFEEIYKIYEQDKELTHPVYSKVGEYYQFVLDHWSEAVLRYQEIYESSEVAWAIRWGGR